MNLLRRLALFVCFSIGVSLMAAPVADFAPSVKQGCVPLTISFVDKSTGGAVSYQWDFGNGNKSTLQSPSAIFYKSGNFTITLTVTDASGNKDSKTFSPIRVFASPSAIFSADTVGCVKELLSFKDLSVKADTAIVKWTWDFGDGSLGDEMTASHKYTYSGKFTIGLTIVDGYGCKSLKTQNNYIRIKPSPVSNFTLDKTYNCALPGVFNGKNTSTGANSYKWTCSDGSNAVTKDFKTNISSFGKYTITLISIGNGCNDTATKSLNLEKLSVKFTLPRNSLCQGDSVTITNTSNSVPGLTYFWDFGDGTTSTEKNPKKGYAAPGSYQVSLSVSSGACKDSARQQVKVNPAPEAQISVVDSVGCAPPFRAVFRVSGNDYSSSLWSFGDKSIPQSFQKGSTIDHIYQNKGVYAVTAKIINSFGCPLDLKLENNINVGVQLVNIDPDEVKACLPVTIKYKPIEKLFQQVKSYEWIFTDDQGTKYTSKNVSKTFTKPGNFLAVLKIETVNGCIITDTAKISVGNKYYPTFKITQRDICQNDTVHYVNTTHDSIKAKVTFALKVKYSNADIIRGDTNAVFRESILKAQRGGLHAIKITARHFGCITESVLADTVNVHGPFIGLTIRPLDCKYTKVSLKATYSWANRVELVKDDTLILDHRQKEIITSYNPSRFIFRGWNDTFQCKDSIIPDLQFPRRSPDITYNLNQNCAPARGTFDHNGTLKAAKWIFPNGDTSVVKRALYTFKEPGMQMVMLIGHYDSAMCPDTNRVYVKIQGAIMRGGVVANGKCMPIMLSLTDSMVGKDDNHHTWKIGNDVVEPSQMITPYNVLGVPQNDSVITVKHIIQSANGCVSEKEYQLPFGGPRASYLYQRFTICDTPVFYFKSFVDSVRSKLPVTYKWETSSGMVVNAQNFNAKFRTMGMNYFTLTITDKLNCKSVFYDSFEVSPNMLMPGFKADPSGRFCPPLQCQFTDFSKTFNSEIIKWEWDFGDGTTSQLKNPQKLYLLPGSYDITLKLTSKSGCTTVLKKPGYVIVNGPRGSYDFDRGNGCLPLTVGFYGKTLDSATMEWDLGDGVVRPGNNFRHVYNQRGRYIPAMILSDTLGCKYTLPPIDTIEVYDYPQARTMLSGLCFHQPIKVRQTSISNHDNPDVKVSWFLNGNLKSPGTDSSFMPEERGEQHVRIIAENSGKCKDTFDNHIKIYAPKSDFKVTRDFVCLGNVTDFLNEVTSDTTITFYRWNFGDGTGSNDKKVRHTYNAPGKYDVSLIARDVMNCEDTMTRLEYAVVGDTVSPPQVPIRRASVLNNRHVELVFSKYPTFDFTKYTIYRESGGRYYKMADVTGPDDTMYIDRQCNTLKESYCYKISSQNLCLYTSDIDFSREHCTIETKAAGFMDANKVSWSPYVGFDSIARYQIWRQDYDQKGPYELLDSVNSTQLTYTDTLIMCNTRKNYLIKAIQHDGFREYSFSDTASAKPHYVNSTLPGYAWRATVENNEYTRVEWLNNAWSRNGIRGYLLSKYFADGQKVFEYQYYDALDTIYEDSKVKVNNYSYVYYLRGIDNCDDTTPVSNPAQTILLKAYFDETTQKPALSWNHYREWDQKTAYYEIEQKQADGSFLLVGKVSATENGFIDMNAKSTCSPDYVYRVRAVSYIHTPTGNFAVSLSNEARAYPTSKLFVPNAFSPDMNGINEGFGPNGQYISRYKFQIYNRWGEKLFETTDCMAPWNGTFMNERCQEGVYLYHLEALGADNKTYNLQGTFTLLR